MCLVQQNLPQFLEGVLIHWGGSPPSNLSPVKPGVDGFPASCTKIYI